MEQNKKIYAVVLAAGKGKRMNSDTAKQYLLLQDKPILYYALKAFEDSVVDGVVLVTGADQVEYCQREIVDKYGFTKVCAVVTGGKERYHSVYEGLKKISELSVSDGADIVLIHDGARPFVTKDMISLLVQETKIHSACVTGTKVKDTVKLADENGYSDQTLKRDLLWAVQTPQTFSFDLIYRAYTELIDQEADLLAKGILITDDAMVVETMCHKKTKLVEGDYKNIKITTPEDLIIAKAFLDVDN